MHRPELLVLDDATSGLDPLLRQEFVNLVEETAAEGTVTLDALRSHAPRTMELVFDHRSTPRRSPSSRAWK